jgi:RNA polymerase sigma factor (sigma-70 family)
LRKPLVCNVNIGRAVSRAWLRCSPIRSPVIRVPAGVVTGSVMACRASIPTIGSWLMVWTRSRRRLAWKPISRRAGRFVSRFPIPKSQASRFDPTLGSTATWVKHVARARAVDRVRLCESAGARDTRYTAASRAVDYDTVVERVLRRDEQASLRESLQRLAPLQRESIVLAYYAGLSTAEISERLNVNRSTIKTRIRDGLKSSPPIYRRLLRRSRNWWSPRRRTADSNSVRVRVQRPWWIPVQAQNTEHLLSSIGVGGTAGSLNRLAEEPNIPMKR